MEKVYSALEAVGGYVVVNDRLMAARVIFGYDPNDESIDIAQLMREGTPIQRLIPEDFELDKKAVKYFRGLMKEYGTRVFGGRGELKVGGFVMIEALDEFREERKRRLNLSEA